MKRVCDVNNYTILYILENCKTSIEKRNTIDLFNAYTFLKKALEGIETKKDLTYCEQEDIKRIRELIKGL